MVAKIWVIVVVLVSLGKGMVVGGGGMLGVGEGGTFSCLLMAH